MMNDVLPSIIRKNRAQVTDSGNILFATSRNVAFLEIGIHLPINFYTMRTQTIQTSYSVYDSPDQLPDADQQLLSLAKSSLGNSYSPYSNFKVGAAALLGNGEMVGGSNYENASYPMCICAEQTVLTTAANCFPNVPVVALAVTVKNPKQVIAQPGPPCGACRQVICETEWKNHQEMRIILQGEAGPVYVFEKGLDLLPMAFDGSYL